MKNKLDISYNLSDFEDEEPGNFEGNSHKAHRTQSRNFPSIWLKAQYFVLLLGENILNVQSLGYEEKKKKKGKEYIRNSYLSSQPIQTLFIWNKSMYFRLVHGSQLCVINNL